MVAQGRLNARVATEYPLSAAVRTRLLGGLVVVVGGLVLLLALLSWLLSWPPVVLGIVVTLAALVVVVVGGLIARPRYLLRTDAGGYRVRFIRGSAVSSAQWTDVEDLATTYAGDTRVVVIRLRDGRTTRIPVDVLAVDPEHLVTDLRTLLGRFA